MTSFVVLQHDDEPTARASEKTVFVRDAFSIVALAFPILWLFWHQLWVAGGCAIVLFFAIGVFVGEQVELFWLLMVFNVFLSLFVAIEGSAWRMVALRFSGYKDCAIIEAENLEQAQLKWALGLKAAETNLSHRVQSMVSTKHDDDLIFSANGLT